MNAKRNRQHIVTIQAMRNEQSMMGVPIEIEALDAAIAALSPQADKARWEVPLTAVNLADALDCFWNAALDATRRQEDSTANAVMNGMVEGMASVAARLREIAATPQPQGDASPEDDRFPGGFADAIRYADEMEEAAASLHQQVLGYETDGSDTGTGMLQAIARNLAATPQVSGGGEALAVAAAMLRIAPTCESDWDKQLREWASRLSSTPQVSGGGDAWPAVDRIIADAYNAGLNDEAFDMLGAQRRFRAALSTTQARPSCGTCGGRIRPDAMTGTACDCTPQARPSDDALWDQTILERDEAEDALGRMFQAVTGRPAEWSSAWHYGDAIDEVEDHVAGLQQARPDGGECDECEGRGYIVIYVDPYGRGDVSSPEHSPCPECDHPAPAPDAANGVPITPIAGDVARLVEVAEFLDGSGTLEGRHFGQTNGKGGAYWWRKHLREALAPFIAAQQESNDGH